MENQNHLKPIVRRKNPSFSSSLLDEIYRSFDDQTTPEAREATESSMISAEYHFPQSPRLNSCSSSSESSFWTSSEPETSNAVCQSKLAVKTSILTLQKQEEDDRIYVSEQKSKKSKALKTYDDLKKSKVNQGFLASFLSTLFISTSTRNDKKSKIDKRKHASVNASSACSSLFRTSCFTKTPSSRGKLSDGMTRSVRFYPVTSVIMDEDRIYKDNGRHNYDNRRAREVLKKYEKKLEEIMMMNEDEDCESCASSDLFELDNLDAVTASRQRYSEELPVFETTSVDANRAIAYGLLK
ncbi:protein BIG GRAIN 1-like A [Apium graveolens]|uniref:protein BIG GRAIN 1-like A n=1 Tax=Apium graveolens TaxID=4045 RepID=UPI003D79C5C6